MMRTLLIRLLRPVVLEIVRNEMHKGGRFSKEFRRSSQTFPGAETSPAGCRLGADGRRSSGEVA